MKPSIYKSSQTGYHDKPRDLSHDDLRTMELPVRFWDAKRSQIPEGERVREVLDTFASSCPRIMAAGDPSMILFHGASGTGKTSAAAIIAKVCRAHRYTSFFVDGASLLKRFMSSEPSADGELSVRERAYETECLVLDALGQGYSTSDYVASETGALIKYRQDNRSLTALTTSLSLEELEKLYGTPFVGHLRETCTLVRCVTPFRGVQPIAGKKP